MPVQLLLALLSTSMVSMCMYNDKCFHDKAKVIRPILDLRLHPLFTVQLGPNLPNYNV